MLDPAAFDSMLGCLGQNVSWRRSHACPCVGSAGQINSSCPHCDGTGRIWEDGESSVVGVTGGDPVRKYANMEVLDAGDVLMVLPASQPAYEMGEFDRVEMADRTEPFSMALVSGIHDRLRFRPQDIDRVFWISGTSIVDGAIPASSDSGDLTWASGAPPSGVTYTVSGRRHPEYYCYLMLPRDRPHGRGLPLPRRALMRRLDLFWR